MVSRQRIKQGWCLAEAIRDIHRERCADAICFGLHSDGADKRLSVQYTCVHKETLITRQGHLGMMHDSGTGSDAIVVGILNCLDRFCTRRANPPRGVHAIPALDEELYQQMVNGTQLLDADAASDEQRALRSIQQALPNVRYRLRDKTHASRRLTSKPWQHDAVFG